MVVKYENLENILYEKGFDESSTFFDMSLYLKDLLGDAYKIDLRVTSEYDAIIKFTNYSHGMVSYSNEYVCLLDEFGDIKVYKRYYDSFSAANVPGYNGVYSDLLILTDDKENCKYRNKYTVEGTKLKMYSSLNGLKRVLKEL